MKKVKFSNPVFWGRTFQNSSIGEWSVDANGIVETDEVAYFVDGFGCEVVVDDVVKPDDAGNAESEEVVPETELDVVEDVDLNDSASEQSTPEKGRRGRKPKTAND